MKRDDTERARARKEYMREYSRKWREANREHRREYARANSEANNKRGKIWRDANKKRLREYDLQRKYGLTETEWWALFDEQGLKCAICETNTPDGYGWQTDHCHTTGNVRGILCTKCNIGLGYFNDNPDTLSRAIAYLSRCGSRS